MIKRLVLLSAGAALMAAACGGTDSATTTVAPPAASSTTTTMAAQAAPPTTTTTGAPAASEPSVAVAVADSSALGEILVDGDGNTLYLFTPDDSGPSVCNDDCAAAWPPVLGVATAGTGIDVDLLGTAARDDGAMQATYNSWPLYYFARDAAPGDINGQGLNDVWYVITPTGEAIK